MTKDEKQITIAAGFGLIFVGLVGGFVGGDPSSLAGVVMGVGLLAWLVWKTRFADR